MSVVAATGPIRLSAKEWHGRRSRGIGASEVASILGMGKYGDVLTIWASKRGLVPPQEETAAMRRGHAMEAYIASEFSRATGIALVDPGPYTVWQSPDVEWLWATPDFHTAALEPVETKWLGYFTGQDLLEEGFPWAHKCQLQAQLHCMGPQAAGHRGALAACIDHQDDPVIEWFDFSKEFWDAAMEHLDYFWTVNVLRGVEPTVERHSESFWRTFRKLHPIGNGQAVTLPAELEKTVEKWRYAKRQVAHWKAVQFDNAAAVKQAIGDYSFGTVGGACLSFKESPERRYLRVSAEHVDRLKAAGIPFEEKVTEASRTLLEVKRIS